MEDLDHTPDAGAALQVNNELDAGGDLVSDDVVRQFHGALERT
jgi:hypothetical protein